MGMLKGRHLKVSVEKDSDQPEVVQDVIVPAEVAKEVQETVRIISAHVVMGVGTYVLLDTFRKVVVKMVPGR